MSIFHAQNSDKSENALSAFYGTSAVEWGYLHPLGWYSYFVVDNLFCNRCIQIGWSRAAAPAAWFVADFSGAETATHGWGLLNMAAGRILIKCCYFTDIGMGQIGQSMRIFLFLRKNGNDTKFRHFLLIYSVVQILLRIFWSHMVYNSLYCNI